MLCYYEIMGSDMYVSFAHISCTFSGAFIFDKPWVPYWATLLEHVPNMV